ncbi:2Fe-2S iron-sulfur cluster-binding protein [Streptomyces cirratus]
MTVTTNAPAGGGGAAVPPEDLVSLTIDGIELSVPKGTLVIRAAEQLGIEIPRFCDHPLLDPVGACRQCIVEVEGQRKPMASCTITCTDGMVVKTQLTSQAAEKAQRGVMELLLINHPLDCPVCDKGGECPLQNQALSHGNAESRFEGKKRTYEKPVAISTQVLLDRERCVLCARCTRFSTQVAGDPMIELLERGALQQVGTGEGDPFESYFSGNTIQICPVGALTSAEYRFRARPFDLVSSPSVCEHCAGGCATRTDHRRGKVLRRLPPRTPRSTRSGSATRARFAFRYAQRPDRLTTPLVRGSDGVLAPASWPEALEAAAKGLASARGRAGVLTGGRLTAEDAYAYAKFARVVLGHQRHRLPGAGAQRGGGRVPGRHRGRHRQGPRGGGVTYSSLEAAPAVLLAGIESEEEAPGSSCGCARPTAGTSSGPSASPRSPPGAWRRRAAPCWPPPPGPKPDWLDALASRTGLEQGGHAAAEALREPGAVIVVGGTPGRGAGRADRRGTGGGRDRRAAGVGSRAGPGSGPPWRRARCRPLCPRGARPATDPRAREEVAAAWGLTNSRTATAATTGQIVEAAAGREGAVRAARRGRRGGRPARPGPRPPRAPGGVRVSLETAAQRGHRPRRRGLPRRRGRREGGGVHQLGGPRAAVRGGAQARPDDPQARARRPPRAAHAGRRGGPADRAPRRARRTAGTGPARPVGRGTCRRAARGRRAAARPGVGEAVLAGHRLLLDQGRLQDGDAALAGTRHEASARLSAATAAETGVKDGDVLAVTGPAGTVELPLRVTRMPDRVVWLPMNSTGSGVLADTGARPGALVRIGPAVPSGAGDSTAEVEA